MEHSGNGKEANVVGVEEESGEEGQEAGGIQKQRQPHQPLLLMKICPSRVYTTLNTRPMSSFQRAFHHRSSLVVPIIRIPSRNQLPWCLAHRQHQYKAGPVDVQGSPAWGLRAAAEIQGEVPGARGTWEAATEGLPLDTNSAFPPEGFEFWSLDVNGGDEWKVEELSGDQRKEFPNDQVKKYFVTSYYTCLKSQVVDLKAEGYWEELMDTTRPDIEVKDWFAARPDCGSKYQLCVQLLSSAHAPLGTFQPDPATIQQKSDAKWREVSHTFSNYPPGVRYIWFQHGGVDTHYWAGWYGPRVTNSSITIGPPLP
ncbi:F-box only protein 44 [Physeter macrocephalus]|uniref:F-box only protein 44 n=1 Tax=Physeter macrocephalus TaxID=9755 RepID=A0A9W2WGD9_PHYMC|nr:F-box only protein 44 [Physeter catodon]